MRVLLCAAGAALMLSACGSDRGESEASSANMTATDANMLATDPNMMGTDANMMMDANAMNGATMNNMAMDPATQNAMKQDMNSNDPDTNLANGM
jgi:hypothetical protein